MRECPLLLLRFGDERGDVHSECEHPLHLRQIFGDQLSGIVEQIATEYVYRQVHDVANYNTWGLNYELINQF